ncbi:hypothetical protein IFR05_017622, partial [Cadophora sp. M221]
MAQNLFRLLKEAAEFVTANGLIIHHSSTTETPWTKISYTQLYEQVVLRAKRLEASGALSKNPVILL